MLSQFHGGRQLRLTLFGERPAAEVLLAQSNGEAIGFALFFSNYSTFLAKPGIYLEDLFVKPHARGKGAGLALFMELSKIAVERGCGRVEWAVLNWNEPSIRFYKKLGAVTLDDWTTFRLTSEPLKRLAATQQRVRLDFGFVLRAVTESGTQFSSRVRKPRFDHCRRMDEPLKYRKRSTSQHKAKSRLSGRMLADPDHIGYDAPCIR